MSLNDFVKELQNRYKGYVGINHVEMDVEEAQHNGNQSCQLGTRGCGDPLETQSPDDFRDNSNTEGYPCHDACAPCGLLVARTSGSQKILFAFPRARR